MTRWACNSLALTTVLLLSGGCSSADKELRLVEPQLAVDKEIAREFASLMRDQSSINVELVAAAGDRQSGIDALLADRADIALVSNNRPYSPDVATVMPMYANVLHILLPVSSEATDVKELFTKGRVFAGAADSPSRLMLLEFAEGQDIGADEINFVDNFNAECPDIVAIFAPIVRNTRAKIDRCNYRLQDLLNPNPNGEPSGIGAAVLFRPSLRTFEIPARTYGPEITPRPIVTLAVDKMLVTRNDVPMSVIYDLIGEISRLRPALASIEPSLFYGLDDKFDSSDSTFVLHPGAQSYIERDEPTVYERYSGIAEVAVTVFFALLSASIAGVRIYNVRRKNRIDVFYARAIELRRSVSDATGMDERRSVISSIRTLQTRAFEMLVDEKLAADESFRIFITLSNDIVRELKDPSAPDWPAADEGF